VVSGQSPENINKKKSFCTLFTEERLKKVDKNFKLSNAVHSITGVQRAQALCRVWDRVPQDDFAIALVIGDRD
jgi:hypothetical protein